MKKILLFFLIGLFITGCSTSNVVSQPTTIDLKDDKYIILDVRTKEEYEEEHIDNAINIPYDEIDENIDLDKEKIIYVYCQSGNRSSIAYEKLKSLGYTVYDLGSYSKTLETINESKN